jgi:hypothetical protein
MNWLKKLNNPFLLVIEGFVAGAILFAATHPGTIDFIPAMGAEHQADLVR